LDGENCGSKLAEYADKRVKRSKVEIADALQGETNSEYMYELRDCYEFIIVRIKCNNFPKSLYR